VEAQGGPPLSPSLVQTILRAVEGVEDEKSHLILIGGQALSAWVAVLEASGYRFTSEPIASGDIDFFGSQRHAKECAIRLGGTARIPTLDDSTPNSGLVSFVDDDGNPRLIDFLYEVAGLDAEDVRRTAQFVTLEVVDDGSEIGVWLLHPERCLESRVHNVLHLKKDTPLGLAQARAAVRIARAFTQVVVMDQEELTERERVRAALDLNERIFDFSKSRKGINIYLEHGIDVFEATLVDDRLPEKFLSCRYPQMRKELATKRERIGKSLRP
jgi:hypothetical protein